MRAGAVLTVAAASEGDAADLSVPSGVRRDFAADCTPIGFWQLLGQSLLDHVCASLRASEIHQVAVVAEEARTEANFAGHRAASSANDGFWRAWETVISRLVRGDIETILLLRVGPYAEVDYQDLLRFHQQSEGAITQVHDHNGPLDLVAVSAAQLRGGNASYRERLSALLPSRRRYWFRGYCNRLSGARDFRRLAQDALGGRCRIRPAASEARIGVWVGDGAVIHPSARIVAPAFVGAGTRLRAGCTIAGASTIEAGCEVDSGTTVDDCCILPGTYIGMGLHVSHAVVSQQRLFHVGRNVAVAIRDGRLVGRASSSGKLVRSLKSLLHRPRAKAAPDGLSTRPEKDASLRDVASGTG